MREPEDPAELSLVVLAIRSYRTRGCCEWNEREARRFRSQPPLPGLTPEGVKELLGDHVANGGGRVIQVVEKRPEYSDRRFYYKVIIPLEELPHGLFVEMVLVDEDPDVPVVHLVSAHP